MDYMKLIPFWEDLNEDEKEYVKTASHVQTYEKGVILHRGEEDCMGIMVVLSGHLKAYVLSEEGREVTLFRLRDGEVCVLSATCLMDSIAFDVMIESTEKTEVFVIPAACLKQLMNQNLKVELFMYKTATDKFSDVMWTMQRILFQKIDQRVATFIWDEMVSEGNLTLSVTHDELARYIGSAREVVSKVLKYMAENQVVELGRGQITIMDKDKLKKLL